MAGEGRKEGKKERCWKGKKKKQHKKVLLDYGKIFSVGVASFLFEVSPVSFFSFLCQNILPQEQVSFHKRNRHASALSALLHNCQKPFFFFFLSKCNACVGWPIENTSLRT